MNCELIKVCGMRDAENIREIERAIGNSSLFTLHSSLFLMGFIFWPKSKRYVSERPSYLPTNCKRVGVFVDEDIEQVKRIADEYELDIIQLHGHESPEYIRLLDNRKIIKAFNIATTGDFALTEAYGGVADYFLFDTKGKSIGGNGEKFDWSLLSAYDGETPFLLSGGIGPNDAERVKAFHHSKCVGIDLNSRFEQTPGLKDIDALRIFLNELSCK